MELFVHNDEPLIFIQALKIIKYWRHFFKFLGDAVNHLQYVGSSSKSTRSSHAEARGAPRALSLLDEFFSSFMSLKVSPAY